MFFLLPLLGFSFRKGNTILGHFLRSNQSTSISPQNVHTCPPLIVIFSAQKLTPHEMCKNHKGKKDLVFYFTLLNKISHVVSDPHHHAPISRNFGTQQQNFILLAFLFQLFEFSSLGNFPCSYSTKRLLYFVKKSYVQVRHPAISQVTLCK